MTQFVPPDPDAFVDELERQVCEQILHQLPPDPSGELVAAPLQSLLLTYGNWRSRFVHPHPRTVYLEQAAGQLEARRA